MRRRSSEYDQGRMVNVGVPHRAEASVWIVVCCRRIREEDHSVISEHCIARSSVTAILRRRATDDDRIGAPFTRDNIEVRPEETAVAMLFYHVFARRRCEF